MARTLYHMGGVYAMAKIDEKVENLIKQAVEAGRLAAQRSPKDTFKATERRLYALPILREKLADDRERLQELRQYGPRERSKSVTRFMKDGVRLSREEVFEAQVMNLEAEIARDEHEIETVEKALTMIEADPYYLAVTGRYLDNISDDEIAELIPCEATTIWRNRKRLVQRLAVRLYGAEAV